MCLLDADVAGNPLQILGTHRSYQPLHTLSASQQKPHHAVIPPQGQEGVVWPRTSGRRRRVHHRLNEFAQLWDFSFSHEAVEHGEAVVGKGGHVWVPVWASGEWLVRSHGYSSSGRLLGLALFGVGVQFNCGRRLRAS
jgi:hypothetical protein